MRLIFKELYLFSPAEKKAKHIEFVDGVNIITSSQEDGTDRGKSVAMRSLYHAMGAEARYDKNWKPDDKVYVLKISIENVDYYIYRSASLYKFFNAQKELLFTTVNSKELAQNLKKYTNFAVQLPNRSDKMEITPPVFNYLPFFLDQDYYNGNEYSSFNKLGQYTNYRENVLFYHLGAYDENYFDLIHEKESTKQHKDEKESELEIIEAMLSELDKKLKGREYAVSLDYLEKDISMYQREYEGVVDQLDKTKKKLIELRNGLYDTEQMLREIENVTNESNKKIKKIKMHVCPECGSKIEDTLSYRSKQYNLIEDAISIKNDLQTSLIEDQKSIEKEEAKYKELLEKMAVYEKKMKINSKEIDDVLRLKGLSELKGDVVSNREDTIEEIEADEKELKSISAKIRAYSEKKKKIEEAYYEGMLTSRTKLGIDELSPETFKKLTNTVKASGSNKNVVTLMWYLIILKLRRQFNPDAIEFPIVFDSINNVETDNEKRGKVLQYVLDNTGSTQLVLSLLGYSKEGIDTDRQVNVIELTNDKYKLLDSATYLKYEQFLDELCNAQ